MDIVHWLARYGQTLWAITVESAPWVLLSLVAGGLIREFLPSTRVQRLMNGSGVPAMGGAVAVGAFLPICSCGVVPLAIGLHRAGVRLGPVMAFTAATPIINPAAVILALGLLGPQLTAAYVAFGLLMPLLLGVLTERWAGQGTAAQDAGAGSREMAGDKGAPLTARMLQALRWGLLELGPAVGFYLAIGILLAGVVMVAAPTSALERYLGGDALVSMLAVGLLGAVIYVCAVAHIPLVATLLAAGAAPGAAIVFLVTGTATNLPELIALYKTIGRRPVILYVATLIATSFAAGLAVNAWLLPGFEPTFDPMRSLDLLERSEGLSITGSGLGSAASAVLMTGLALWGCGLRLRQRFAPVPVAPRAEAGCGCCQHDKPAA